MRAGPADFQRAGLERSVRVVLHYGDNNLTENKIRPFVIGQKNWLFSDTVAGAHTSAAFYSLIETAKANDLEPMIYLQWLFATLPSADPDDVDAISALLPYRVDRDHIAADLAHQYSTTPAVR